MSRGFLIGFNEFLIYIDPPVALASGMGLMAFALLVRFVRRRRNAR